MNQTSIVVGAGIVGVTSALELQRRGRRVILIDRGVPGGETSFGNAGVLTDGSVILANNPELPFQLPRLLFNTNTALRYSFLFVLSRLLWVFRFLCFANKAHMNRAGRALRQLQVRSLAIHKRLLAETKACHLLRESGFLKLYRSKNAYEACRNDRKFYDELGVAYEIYETRDLKDLEPGLKQTYYKGVLLSDTCSVSSPIELTQTYVELYKKLGGQFVKAAVVEMSQQANGHWLVQTGAGENIEADELVLAAGPWSAELVRPLGYKIPMAWERGYHTHLEPSDRNPLRRPIHEVEGGFVAAPQREGVRISTGVELTFRDAAPNYKQITAAVAAAKDILELGTEDQTPWLGSRPTLVDSLPMVGAATRHRGLWFNFGHQHVGLSISTGCAEILADLMERKIPQIDYQTFRPDRFRI